MNRNTLAAIPLALAALAAPAVATETSQDSVEELRRQMEEMERRHDAEMKALRDEMKGLKDAASPRRGDELEGAIDEYLERLEDVERRIGILGPDGMTRFVDTSIVGTFAAGTSTATEDEIRELQAGGHDPHQRGFTVQTIELVMRGAVDPYFRAEAAISWNWRRRSPRPLRFPGDWRSRQGTSTRSSAFTIRRTRTSGRSSMHRSSTRVSSAPMGRELRA
jgi:hypothetical protein